MNTKNNKRRQASQEKIEKAGGKAEVV